MDNEFETLGMEATAELTSKLRPVKQDPVKRLREAAELAGERDEEEITFALSDLLEVMREHGASDLHIKEGSPPTVRIHGELFGIGEKKLTPRECRELIFSACTRTQQELLELGSEIDFAYKHAGVQYRINAHLQKSTFAASIRMVRTKIPDFETLNLPPQIKDMVERPNGLVLVTGPAGSGKSTTLASIIQYLNTNKALHIITIEDPIEYIHTHKKSIITQREIGTDTNSFQDALKYALRQDPDVILIGEMRDPETIMIAAQAAETGHLVLSTLHTSNAVQAISRILDVFTGENRRQMQLLLASNLRGILSQRLISRTDTEGRVPAVEVMFLTPTIGSLILEENINDIYKFIAEGANEGMQTMNQSLYRLFSEGIISYKDAISNSDFPNELRLMIDGHEVYKPRKDDDTLMSWL